MSASTSRVVTELVEGDIIDLQPAVASYTTYIDELDISAYELAVVDSVELEWSDEYGATIAVLYTDQHNIAVPSDYEVEVML